MSRQFAQRQAAEKLLLEAMQGTGRAWIGATAMAERLGWPWRIVCRTLQRLAEQGAIESGRGVEEQAVADQEDDALPGAGGSAAGQLPGLAVAGGARGGGGCSAGVV